MTGEALANARAELADIANNVPVGEYGARFGIYTEGMSREQILNEVYAMIGEKYQKAGDSNAQNLASADGQNGKENNEEPDNNPQNNNGSQKGSENTGSGGGTEPIDHAAVRQKIINSINSVEPSGELAADENGNPRYSVAEHYQSLVHNLKNKVAEIKANCKQMFGVEYSQLDDLTKREMAVAVSGKIAGAFQGQIVYDNRADGQELWDSNGQAKMPYKSADGKYSITCVQLIGLTAFMMGSTKPGSSTPVWWSPGQTPYTYSKDYRCPKLDQNGNIGPDGGYPGVTNLANNEDIIDRDNMISNSQMETKIKKFQDIFNSGNQTEIIKFQTEFANQLKGRIAFLGNGSFETPITQPTDDPRNHTYRHSAIIRDVTFTGNQINFVFTEAGGNNLQQQYTISYEKLLDKYARMDIFRLAIQ